MYLKTLELQGFKSFPDKTVIEFNKGMTAIVGANGSGKSNISDAVRWVLGEMSAKSLRGAKMEDIIFNGSSKRKPANFAEVIMTIDNSDYLMKIDFDEVSVGRRLYRSGESEYTLNQKKVRLKDVVDLFLNTGIGREGYSVISQGKIAEIISLKGNERRELFEEAAGISRFRYRKTEAASKLVSVTENAVRINDILSEVQGRIPKLEQQSEKAKKYLDIAGEKRSLELGIWSKRIEKIEKLENDSASELGEKEAQLKELTDSIENFDTELDKMYVDNQKDSMASEIIRSEISALSNEQSEKMSRLSVLENELYHFDEKKREVIETGSASSEKAKNLEKEKNEKNEELQKTISEADAVAKEIELNKEKTEEVSNKFLNVSEEETKILSEKTILQEKIHASSLLMKESEGISIARFERQTALSKMKEEIISEKEEKDGKLKQLISELENKTLELKEERVKNGKLNLEIMKEKEFCGDKSDSLNMLKLEKLEKEKLRDTLQRMERLLEGFSESVKEVMKASGTVLNGICGPVSKIISVDEKYVLAIETALGQGMQNIIVEDEISAKEAIRYLKNNRMGRATFLPLDTVKGGVWRTGTVTNKGFVGIASELCRFDGKYNSAIEHLLGKVLVCDTIDSASEIAKGEKFGVKVVTLDGQVINAGGSFTGGQTQNKSGVISRTRDINNLNEEIADFDEKTAKLKSEIENSEKKLKELREEESKSAHLIEILSDEEATKKNEVAVFREKAELTEEKLSEILNELGEIEKYHLEKEEKKKEFENENKNHLDALSGIEVRLAEFSEEKAELSRKREELLYEKGNLSAKFASLEVIISNLSSSLAEIENALEEVVSSEKNAEVILQNLETDKTNAEKEIEELKSRKEEISSEISQKQGEIASLTERIAKRSETSNSYRAEQKEMISEKEILLDKSSRLRGVISGISKEKSDIAQKLADEYELGFDSEEFISAKETDTDSLGGNQRLAVLRKELRNIGPVNLESVDELREAKERFEFLNAQYTDITKSKEELEKLIFELEGTMREMFSETFEAVRYSFKQIFTELFGGGSADIELTDKEDLLNCGVEIKVQPPGKLVKNLSLLSGGEQAFVAIALYMSLLKINPSPFCIFDEIESALDEANVKRFAQYIKKHNDKTQFIVITHRRGTMEEADTLYGIAMQEKGVSDFIKLDSDQINNYASDNK